MLDGESSESLRKLARAAITGDITTQQLTERMRGMSPEDLGHLADELHALADRAGGSPRHAEKRTD